MVFGARSTRCASTSIRRSCGAPDRHRPGRAGDQRLQRQQAHRHALRPGAQLRRAGERPVDVGGAVPADRRRLSQRQPGAARGSRHVYDGVENPRNGSWYNGKPALYLGIQRQPGTNTVEVVDA
jgi:hypothetical protein